MGTGTGGLCLGVDIGGTKTRVGLVDADHRVLDVREAPTPAQDGPRAVLGVVAGLGRALGGRRADAAA
ncbi:MAG TPA: ROK family protein, partial [Actinomycetota bacterium]|nr:ROK family protein [Actinomycetota bacterium]